MCQTIVITAKRIHGEMLCVYYVNIVLVANTQGGMCRHICLVYKGVINVSD